MGRRTHSYRNHLPEQLRSELSDDQIQRLVLELRPLAEEIADLYACNSDGEPPEMHDSFAEEQPDVLMEQAEVLMDALQISLSEALKLVATNQQLNGVNGG